MLQIILEAITRQRSFFDYGFWCYHPGGGKTERERALGWGGSTCLSVLFWFSILVR